VSCAKKFVFHFGIGRAEFSCLYDSKALLIVSVSDIIFVLFIFSSYHCFDDSHITASNTIIEIAIIISTIEKAFLEFFMYIIFIKIIFSHFFKGSALTVREEVLLGVYPQGEGLEKLVQY
jgi:hypothetical protein